MFERAIFSPGIQSLLKVEWKLTLATPLCVRAKRTFKWNSSGNKSRNTSIDYNWNKTTGDGNNIFDLHFDLVIKNGELIPFYSVPASSIRGTLRTWTIQHFVKRSDWNLANLEKKDDRDIPRLKSIIESEDAGFSLITNLFGISIDPDDSLDFAHASCIRFQTRPFSNGDFRPNIAGHLAENNVYGPDNAAFQIKERSPIDRITQGSKDGGLHTYLEFSPGQSFDVIIDIVNPKKEYLGLISLWEREINDGEILFGALKSNSRGQFKITRKSHRFFSSSADNNISIRSIKSEYADIMNILWETYSLDCSDFISDLTSLFK